MKLSDTKAFQRISVIYGIENTVTSKWYVGSCLDFKDRFERHRYYLKHNNHHSTKLQRAYNLYGEDVFEVHVLHNLTEGEDRFELEQQYIEEYNCVENGYNMLDRCIYVDNFKLSESAKANFLEYIKTLKKSVIAINRVTGNIDNTFDSIGDAANYYKTSSSNISRVCKGSLNYIKNHVFVYSEDFDVTKDYRVVHHCKGKEKPLSQILKMRHNKRCTMVYKYDLKGNLVNSYFSISEAARQNNISANLLRYKINKGREANGFLYSKSNNAANAA